MEIKKLGQDDPRSQAFLDMRMEAEGGRWNDGSGKMVKGKCCGSQMGLSEPSYHLKYN
jgi:hypothetical protein